jgi:PiT family inorganic phosphate transporter
MGASRFGLPVSTTHVSASSILGVGLANGKFLNRQTVYSIVFAWLVTVPVSAIFGALIYSCFQI